MIEIASVRQIPGEPHRRWFSSAQFDLIVRCAGESGFLGFELCYDKPFRERAIVYSAEEGFRHMAVDDGEQRPGKFKSSPVLVADGVFDVMRVYAAFVGVSAKLPAEVANYVRQALEQHPDYQKSPGAIPKPDAAAL